LDAGPPEHTPRVGWAFLARVAEGHASQYRSRMREELARSLGPVQFSDLRAHIARDAVIVVHVSLDLLEVGEAIARDDKMRVAEWIEAGLVGKPSLEVLDRWAKVEGPAWTSLVVQPFVLVREGVDPQA
jgi:hypothetical protein